MAEPDARLCIGIDVGGTFTDCVLSDGTSTWRAKSPTTPGALGVGVLAAVRLACERRGATLEESLRHVERFGLGTTAVTNVLASETGRKVGVLTTYGFEEALLFARGARVLGDDGWLVRPGQIVERRAIAAIRERIDRNGNVLVPLDPEAVAQAARRLVDVEHVEAVAVSFLWSFANPIHENQAVAIVRELYPDFSVMSGAALHPAAREFERTTFAVLNAYVSGALGGIDELDSELRTLGLTVPLLLVHSGGGSITIDEARLRPLGLAMSGPAAGVAAAVCVAEAARTNRVITCDMGGTSFDVSIIADGVPARRTRGDLMGLWTALPLIDIESIGAGGGSFGWIDARGMLRVGPRSAGALPGPACYGRGGTEATVTDALVVLGYVDPAGFLGGDFVLNAAAATEACARLGARLGLDADETAWGIRELALADMIRATRARAGALGLDPREHAILSFGGSGSLFTPDIAAALGAATVLVPQLASVLSAFGAATTDIRRERLQSITRPIDGDPSWFTDCANDLAASVRRDLDADGVTPEAQDVTFEADLRFSRQSFELSIPFRGEGFDSDGLQALVDEFLIEYTKRYGRGSITLGVPIEVVSVRAVGWGRTIQAALERYDRGDDAKTKPPEPVGVRSVRVSRAACGITEFPAYERSSFGFGCTVAGPALVDGPDTTIWIPENAQALVDRYGTLVVQIGSKEDAI